MKAIARTIGATILALSAPLTAAAAAPSGTIPAASTRVARHGREGDAAQRASVHQAVRRMRHAQTGERAVPKGDGLLRHSPAPSTSLHTVLRLGPRIGAPTLRSPSHPASSLSRSESHLAGPSDRAPLLRIRTANLAHCNSNLDRIQVIRTSKPSQSRTRGRGRFDSSVQTGELRCEHIRLQSKVRRAAATPENLVVTAATDQFSALASCPASGAANYTLRCAVLQAAQDCPSDEGSGATCDTIYFDIPEGSTGCAATAPTINGRSVFSCTIATTSTLPLTASNTTVDGFDAAPGDPVPGTPSPCSAPCGASPNTNTLMSASSTGDNAVYAIDLAGMSASSGSDGFQVTGSDDAVEGLEITGFPGDGVQITAAASSSCQGNSGSTVEACRDVISGNFIGLTNASTGSADANSDGVSLILTTTGTRVSAETVGGASPAAANVISDNRGGCESCTGALAPGAGVLVEGASASSIEGNLIGTNPAGESAAANTYGVEVEYAEVNGANVAGVGVVIGGGSVGAGNVISGSVRSGVRDDTGAGETVEGNFIGADLTGAKNLENQWEGVQCDVCGSGPNTVIIGGTGGVPGGPGCNFATAPCLGNLISGNGDHGVAVEGGSGGVIQGNLIGTDITGASRLPNSVRGVDIYQGSGAPSPPQDIVVGGTATGEGNVISGNGEDGLDIEAGSGHTVQGNLIGSGATGDSALGNQYRGVDISQGTGASSPSQGIEIGGTAAGAGNLIEHNGLGGVNVGSDSHENAVAAIQQNAVLDNGSSIVSFSTSHEMSLDTSLSGCTAGPAAGQPNDAMPCPVITGEKSNGSNQITAIQGTALTGATVEVYTASDGLYDSLQGGGQIYLGTATATSGSSCPAGVTPATGWSCWELDATSGLLPSCSSGPACVSTGFALVPDQPVTAMATRQAPGSSPAQYETSEFAVDFGAPSVFDLTVTATGDSVPGRPCDNADGSFVSTISLRCAMSEANLASNQTVRFAIPSAGNACAGTPTLCTISPAAALPPLLATNESIDGYLGSPGGAMPNTNPLGQPDNALITVRLDGAGDVSGDGIDIESAGDSVRGLSISGFRGFGVDMISPASGAVVDGDFVGLEPDGVTQNGNSRGGIGLSGAGNTIGGTTPGSRMVISGNKDDGVMIFDDSSGAHIEGCYIGANSAGTTAIANGTGIELQAPAQIGVGATGGGNVISGNSRDGVDIENAGSSLQGNDIGTNALGTAAIGNGLAAYNSGSYGDGVYIDNSGQGAIHNTVGPNNLISGNYGYGVEIYGGGSHAGGDQNNVTGNTIGLDVNGNPLGNSYDGVALDGSAGSGNTATGDTIGGPSTTNRNVISGNTQFGVDAYSGDGPNTIEGNYIGLNPAGDGAAPNGQGGIKLSADETVTHNTISGNGGDGVDVDASGSVLQSNDIGTLPSAVSGNGAGNTIVRSRGAVGGTAGASTAGSNDGNGILVSGGVSGIAIGGTSAGQGNVIVFNDLSGIKIGSSSSDSSHASMEENDIYDNIQNPGAGFAAGQAGEVYLTGEDPATCDSIAGTNSAGKPDDYLPCPALVTYDKISGMAAATTCAGCTVDFYVWTATTSTAGGGGGNADESHGGATRWVMSMTAGGTPCDPTVAGSCSDTIPVTTTLPTGLSGITATATITSPSQATVTDTSEFSADTGGPTIARVAWFRVRHDGAKLIFRWRMADQSGVAGFELYSGEKRLNRRLIRVHANHLYTDGATWTGPLIRFSLGIVLASGRMLRYSHNSR